MLEKAIDWIKNNSIRGQGMVISSRKTVSYPEVTGYLIPTLLSVGERNLACAYAQWLLSVQHPDGSFGLGKSSYAFDTGQVVRGWTQMIERMPELEEPLHRACDWLIETADGTTGRLLVPPSGRDWSLGQRGEVSEGIHLYVLAPIRRAGELLSESRYGRFVSKSANYYLKNVCLTDFSQPNALSHFYAYVQEALVELGYEDEAQQGMASVARFQQLSGAVPAYSDVNWICSAGLAQFALVWYRLGQTKRADAALHFLESLQNHSGGFFGSYGVGADYFPAEEISWAAKYAIEACQQQIASHFNQSANMYSTDITETDGRVQAILRHLGNLDGKRVLDAGCGKGRYLAIINQRYPGADLTGLDISAEMLKHVPPGIHTVRHGILNMPFADEQFDAIICIEALEHVVQVEQAIAELTRVLAPGGTLLIIDKNKDKLGALEMPRWEKWFGSQELLRVLKSNGLEASAEFVGYDNVTQPDGLFICWGGRKAGLQPGTSAFLPSKRTNEYRHSTSGYQGNLTLNVKSAEPIRQATKANKPDILYYGSCWPTNMGNSFVNLGAIQSIKLALGESADIAHFGGLSSYLFTSKGQGSNCLQIGNLIECRYLVMAGMVMCDDNFLTQHGILQQFVERNTKIVVLGGGAAKYDRKERGKVREWLGRIKIHALISRDQFSYDEYGDLTSHSFNGIDSAFFISDYFTPPQLSVQGFSVLTFDSIPEPELLGIRKEAVLRTHHSPWWTKDHFFAKPNTLISDLPTDYLTLYANAKATFSDRVHACIASLAYGNRAMLFNNTPRLQMFKQVGAENINKEPVAVDPDLLQSKKNAQLDFIKRIFTCREPEEASKSLSKFERKERQSCGMPKANVVEA